MPRPPGGGRRPTAFPPALKRLGQHFLTDRRVLERIADALALAPGETVVEIGPGRGALTELLLERAGRVVVIELDRALAEAWRTRAAMDPRLTVIEGDVLETELGAAAGGGPFVLAGNVPYYITTPILFHALRRPRPERAVYLVQREVAERIVAPPGGKEYGALSVNVQSVARAEILFGVPARAFSPPPKVESAVVRITPRADPVVTEEEETRFRAFVQEAFGLRRKQMRRVVRTILRLDAERAEALLAAAGVDPEARPETLSPEAFARVMRAGGERSS
ncbi:MAG TPA: 16S rRNA (adenine(1518)-N(6)/adenine(1519)-N(6))-dimethyltransferase RsmA [Gemmatimonadaceae bacterium]